MKKIIFLSLCTLFLFSCGNDNSSSGPVAADLAGFAMTNYSGSSVRKAAKVDGAGKILEEGDVLNGTKNGLWITYHPEDNRVKTMTSYVNGKKNGVHMELNNRGQVELQCHYTDDIFDGLWSKFKFGSRKEKEVNYKMGKFDGVYKEYHTNGKLQKEVHYTDGVQDGPFRQYNDQEQLIMEYEYKNGEKVSGGVITPPAAEEK